MARSQARHPRTPFVVFGSLTVVILVLLAALAVTTATTAPPAIAEYAPQSIQQIKKPPPEQTSDFGQLGGAPVGKPSRPRARRSWTGASRIQSARGTPGSRR